MERARIRVDSLSLEMKGNQPCCNGEIRINGIRLGEGIKNVELALNASDQPIVIVEYIPSRLPEWLQKLIEKDCP